MKSRLLVSLALVLASGTAAADSLDINIHNDAMRIIYGMGLDSVSRGAELELGHMFNQDDQSVSHIGFIISGENWSDAGTFDIGLGGRAVLVNTDPVDATALALGGRVRFSPLQRLGIGAFVFHAPDIVASDADSYTEYGVRLDYQVLPQGFVYVGYRKMELELEDGGPKVELDDNGHVGMRLLF
jgi:hypothetical protein